MSLSKDIEQLTKALKGVVDNPYGCPMCDNGKLRNPEKEHWDDCPYKLANECLKAGFLAASPKGKEEEELKELRAWKESAMRVMPDFQAIGKELGLKLGDTVHDKILPAIINYKKQLGITD